EPLAGDLETTWQCGGHPAVVLPFSLDGYEVNDGTDWNALTQKGLAGWEPTPSAPDQHPWFRRLYERLAGNSCTLAIERAVEAGLNSPDAEVRANAIAFYYAHPKAAGHEHLIDLALGDRAL